MTFDMFNCQSNNSRRFPATCCGELQIKICQNNTKVEQGDFDIGMFFLTFLSRTCPLALKLPYSNTNTTISNIQKLKQNKN